MLTPESKCVHCGSKNNAATSIEKDDFVFPTPGDIAVCWYCGEIQKYGVNLELVQLTEKDKSQITDQYGSLQALRDLGKKIELDEGSVKKTEH